MEDLYQKLIIICDFNPQPSIITTTTDLQNLNSYINLKAKGTYCHTYRYNQIVETKHLKNFTVNFGPQHPAAHGVLRLVLELNLVPK